MIGIDAAESLALLLQITGHETRTAQDGYEALKAAEEYMPDGVLLDIGLPKKHGFDAHLVRPVTNELLMAAMAPVATLM
jgi:DNA-binding response OmpR family regulator